jgi:hypothetical protein
MYKVMSGLNDDGREKIMIDPSRAPSESDYVQIVQRNPFVNISKYETPSRADKNDFIEWWHRVGKTAMCAIYGTNEAKHDAVQHLYPLCKPDDSLASYRGVSVSMPTNETENLYKLYEKLLLRRQNSNAVLVNNTCDVIDRCVHKCDERTRTHAQSLADIEHVKSQYLDALSTKNIFDGYHISDATREVMIKVIHDEFEHEKERLETVKNAEVMHIRAQFVESWPSMDSHLSETSDILEEIEFEKSRLRSIDHPAAPIFNMYDVYKNQLRKIDDESRAAVSKRCERWLHTFEKLNDATSNGKRTYRDWRDV